MRADDAADAVPSGNSGDRSEDIREVVVDGDARVRGTAAMVIHAIAGALARAARGPHLEAPTLQKPGAQSRARSAKVPLASVTRYGTGARSGRGRVASIWRSSADPFSLDNAWSWQPEDWTVAGRRPASRSRESTMEHVERFTRPSASCFDRHRMMRRYVTEDCLR
jgi:hypothetical protein